MKNVQFKVEKDKLIITVDLSLDFGPSKTGKTLVIASTEGNVHARGTAPNTRIGLNVYKYRDES